MSDQRLTLARGEWYGCTMWPGYGDIPYHSPIRVDEVLRCGGGRRRFDLTFFNAGYAAGVQLMTYKLRTLVRERSYLLAQVLEGDRSVAIVPLHLEWCEAHIREAVDRITREMTDAGLSLPQAIVRSL